MWQCDEFLSSILNRLWIIQTRRGQRFFKIEQARGNKGLWNQCFETQTMGLLRAQLDMCYRRKAVGTKGGEISQKRLPLGTWEESYSSVDLKCIWWQEARGALNTVFVSSCPSHQWKTAGPWLLFPSSSFFLVFYMKWFPLPYLPGCQLPTFILSSSIEETPCLNDWQLAGVVP